MSHLNSKRPGGREQRGLALVVVLLLLVVVTLLGLAAMRGTVMQERMSFNATARSIAFQTAEAGLREAEAIAQSKPTMPSTGCSNGLCAMPTGGAASAWETANFWESGTGFRESLRVPDEISDELDLRFVIEDMGQAEGAAADDSCDDGNAFDMTGGCGAPTSAANAQFYRVIVWSRMSNGAQVLLQSTYQVP